MSRLLLLTRIENEIKKNENLNFLITSLKTETGFKTESSIISFIYFIHSFCKYFSVTTKEILDEDKKYLSLEIKDIEYFIEKKSNSWLFFLVFIMNKFYKHSYTVKNLKKDYTLYVKRIKIENGNFDEPKEDIGTPFLETEELEKIYNEADEYTRFIFLLYITTGMRKSALLNCQLSEITENNNILKCIEKGNLMTNYIINPELQYFIVTKKPPKPTEKKIYNRFSKLSKIVNKRIYPHLLRFTYSRIILSHTQDASKVQTALGHKDINTTKKSYIKETNLEKINRLDLPWLTNNSSNNLPFFMTREHVEKFNTLLETN